MLPRNCRTRRPLVCPSRPVLPRSMRRRRHRHLPGTSAISHRTRLPRAGGIALIVLAWLVGYAQFVARLPAGLDASAQWLDEWRALLADHGVQHAVPLRMTADMGPMLCRLPRGYELLVPGLLWQELNATERAAILRHELAHLVRRDVWKSLGVRMLALPHWFNAFAWWAVRRFDEAAEWACDRAASGNQATTVYARALVRLGEVAGRHASYSPAVRGRPLAAHIRRLLAGRLREDSSTKKALLLAACTGFALAALVRVELVARETTPQSETAVVDSELLATADDAPLLDSVSANVVEDIQSSDEPAAAVPAIENQEAALVAQPASDTASAGRGEGGTRAARAGPRQAALSRGDRRGAPALRWHGKNTIRIGSHWMECAPGRCDGSRPRTQASSSSRTRPTPIFLADLASRTCRLRMTTNRSASPASPGTHERAARRTCWRCTRSGPGAAKPKRRP